MQYAFMITHEDMVPRTCTEAMDSPCAEQWRDTIESEIRSLIKLGTWIVVNRPISISHCNRVPLSFVRNILVTYAPVSSSRSIRSLLTSGASHKMIIHQMDVDTAFLNA
jgi:hypothetical protein